MGRDALVWQLLRLLLLGSSLLALWCVSVCVCASLPRFCLIDRHAISQATLEHHPIHPPTHPHAPTTNRGLFILWKATLTDQSAKHARISLKFVAIKLLIVVGVVQEYVFSQVAAGKNDDEDHWAVLLPNALLACESPFLTLLMLLAFPLSELEAPPPPPLSSAGSASGDGGVGATSPLLQSPLSPPTRGRRVAAGAEEEDDGDWGVGDLLFTRRGESLGSLERGDNSSDAAAAAAAMARVPSSTEYII